MGKGKAGRVGRRFQTGNGIVAIPSSRGGTATALDRTKYNFVRRGIPKCNLGTRTFALSEARSDPKGLGLALGIELGGDGSDDAGLEAEFPENRPDFLNGHRRLVEVEVNDVVVRIYLVPEAWDRLELMVELKDFVHITNSCSVDLELDHGIYFVVTARNGRGSQR